MKALFVDRVSKPGSYADGGGLYLQVAGPTARSWLFRYRFGKTAQGKSKEHYLGLGSYPATNLEAARGLALEYRRLLDRGQNPRSIRDAERQTTLEVDELGLSVKTFGNCAAEYIRKNDSKWRNAKHAAQWASTLASHAATLTNKPVDTISTNDVEGVLQPIWGKTPETAARLRGRIESVLDYATVSGYRQGHNPARWRGHLAHIFPPRSKVRAVKHHAALQSDRLPAFMAELGQMAGMGALALRFTILTAARTGETLGATWREIDLKNQIWTVPGERMKAGREHRVPLSAAVVAILEGLPTDHADHELVFASAGGAALSNMTLLAVLRRMKVDVTTHGFRSTFRDWVGDETDFPGELAEIALAHRVGDATERAYRRGDGFNKRRELMRAWATYCLSKAVP